MSFLQIPIGTYPNTFLGYQSSIGITTGTENTAFGYLTLNANTTGSDNSAFGSEALRFNVSGSRNTAGGADALLINNANNNTAFGYASQRGNVNGQDNSSFGHDSMRASDDGNENSAFGASSLYNAANTQGNSGFGYLSLYNVTSGLKNSAFGWASGSLITTGSKNSILGSYSGNQGGLDIRTLSNYIVLSDGDGNPRLWIDPAGLVTAPGGFSGGGGGGVLTFNNQTAAYTVVSGDLGKIVNCTANTFTVALTAAATLGSGFNCWIWNTGTGTITIDPNGAETIDGNATFVLRKGQGVQIICTGTAFRTGAPKQYYLYNEDYDNTIGGRPTANNSLGAIALHYGAVATGNTSMAIGFSTSASGENASAIGYRASASGPNSTGLGANSAYQGSQAITGNGAMALGGSYASGADSFAAAVASNTSSYGALAQSAIAIGQNAKANAYYSVAIGGVYNSASGLGSVAIGGYGQTIASGDGAVAIGGGISSSGAVAAARNSFALGDYAHVPTVRGKFAFSADGAFSQGGAQYGNTILRRQTTDATATTMGTDGSSGGALNQVILPNNSAQAFTGTVVARQQAAGGTQSAAWKVEGLIRREGTAASTTLVTSTVTVISNVPGWTLALSADTTNGGLTITATGALATNIRWVATVQTSEVIYT